MEFTFSVEGKIRTEQIVSLAKLFKVRFCATNKEVTCKYDDARKAWLSDPQNKNKKDKMDAAKKGLAAIAYTCCHSESGLLKDAKSWNGLVLADYDHLSSASLAEIESALLERKDELGVLLLERSISGEGLHVVFKGNRALSIPQNQEWLDTQLGAGAKHDGSCTNVNRLLFASGRESDLLYASEALFDYTEEVPLVRETKTKGKTAPRKKSASKEIQNVVDAEPSAASAELTSAESFPQEFQGVLYKDIVKHLEELMGGKPAVGLRHRFLFDMSYYLANICDKNPGWIMPLLSDYTYDFSESDVRHQVECGCSYDLPLKFPSILQRAIDAARGGVPRVNVEEDKDELPAMPKNLPPFLATAIRIIPDIYKPASALAAMAASTVYVNPELDLRYVDNQKCPLTLQVILAAPSSSGKSCLKSAIELVLREAREEDMKANRISDEWKDKVKTLGANKDKPKRPRTFNSCTPPNMTEACFIENLANGEGRNTFFFCEELRTLQQFGGNHFEMMKLAFDAADYSQKRVGVDSVSAHANCNASIVSSGPTHEVVQFFKGKEFDGTIPRICFATIPEQEIGAPIDEVAYGNVIPEDEMQMANYLSNIRRCKGTVKNTVIDNFIRREITRFMDRAVQMQSREYEYLVKRACVIAFRMSYLLFMLQGEWTRREERFIHWVIEYTMYIKMTMFAEQIAKRREDENKIMKGTKGRINYLALCPDTFTFDECVEIRRKAGDKDGTRSKIQNTVRSWKKRGYIKEIKPQVYALTKKGKQARDKNKDKDTDKNNDKDKK